MEGRLEGIERNLRKLKGREWFENLKNKRIKGTRKDIDEDGKSGWEGEGRGWVIRLRKALKGVGRLDWRKDRKR